MSKHVRPPKPSRIYFKQWRLWRGLAQQRLADRIGTSKANVSRHETGRQGYTRGYLEALAAALGTSPAALITYDPSTPKPILILWELAKPRQRKEAYRMLQGERRIAG